VPTVIHVSPHPDDESIGAPCTLLALKDAGWRVVNLACSLGRPEVRERRRAELEAAMKIAEFDLRVVDPPLAISRTDDLEGATRQLVSVLTELITQTGATLVVGPHPRDKHHGHATVARAIRQVVWTAQPHLTWWMWSIWADLPRPTLIANCSIAHLERSEAMLAEYEGENRRNNYLDMHRQIREVNVVRGIETTFGFGAPSDVVAEIKSAELLTEVRRERLHWVVGRPRVLDPTAPLLDDWIPLNDPSIMSTCTPRPLYWPPLLIAYNRLHKPVRKVMDWLLPDPDGRRTALRTPFRRR
jgi:LmbE family N-acetylglucosaminyl deacetylase